MLPVARLAAPRPGALAAALPADPALAAAGVPAAGELRRADAGGRARGVDAQRRARPRGPRRRRWSRRCSEAVIERPQFTITAHRGARRQRRPRRADPGRGLRAACRSRAWRSTSRRCARGSRRSARSSGRGCGRWPSGVLEIRAIERVPAVVWRSAARAAAARPEGVRVAEVDSRLRRADLPLIAGDGAEARVPEALALLDDAEPGARPGARAGARGRAALGPGARPRPGDPAAGGGPRRGAAPGDGARCRGRPARRAT